MFPHFAAPLCLPFLLFAGLSDAQKARVVGQSVPLSGGNASFGRDIRDDAQVHFKSVNAKGGAAGLPIERVSLDNKNDRKLAGVNTQKLLETDNAVALFGYASATLSLDAMPQAEKACILFLHHFLVPNRYVKPTL